MIHKWLSLLKKHRWHFAGAILLGAATILAGIGLMSTSGYLISRAAQRPMIVDLFMITAAVRFFGISRAVVRYFERLVSHDLTFKILLSLRTRLYRKLDSFSMHWMMERRPGDLLASMVSDIETLQNAYLRIISPAVVATLISLITCFFLWIFHPGLGISTLLFLALGGIGVPFLAIRFARGRGKKDAQTRTELKVFLVDRIQGLQDLLWLGHKTKSATLFADMQMELDQVEQRNAGSTGLLEGLSSFFAHTGMFVALILSIPLVISGEIQGTKLAMLVLGVLSSFEAVQNFGSAFLHLETAEESTNRLFSILDKPSSDVPGEKSEKIPQSHHIVFKDVCFSYQERQTTLEDISFDIPQGSKTAIVGTSGSGKSTLINLLMQFWETDKGLITLGNKDLIRFKKEQLASVVNVVLQDSYIFNRSIRENLLIANPEAKDSRLMEVLKTVGLSFLAEHLDQEMGTHGMKLSGGERQLFAIARALLKDAPVWIFDEPTANLDVDTERRILRLLLSGLHDKTVIFITHRLINMDQMDQILVMQQGRIIERGTHPQLISSDTHYMNMVELQGELLKD